MLPSVARLLWTDGRSDETLARSPVMGVLAHRAIATLLTSTPADRMTDIGWREAIAQADQLFGAHLVENRAHRLTIAAATVTYFRLLLPPASWRVHVDVELNIAGHHPDVLWRHSNGRVLIDEIKTGYMNLDTRETRDQALTYLRAGQSAFGCNVVGVRVLSTTSLARSWLLSARGHRQPLAGTAVLPAVPPPRRALRETFPGVCESGPNEASDLGAGPRAPPRFGADCRTDQAPNGAQPWTPTRPWPATGRWGPPPTG